MDGKTEELLEEAEAILRRFKLCAKQWHELLERTRTVGHQIEDRVRHLVEAPSAEKSNPDNNPRRDNRSSG